MALSNNDTDTVARLWTVKSDHLVKPAGKLIDRQQVISALFMYQFHVHAQRCLISA